MMLRSRQIAPSLRFMLMIGGNLLCWNCRGARSGDFLKEMKELQKFYKPLILMLMESKISGNEADEVCLRLRKTHWSRSESTGFS